ncbi:MAG: hypothetical protein AAF269_09320 [Pseudomonadota bacterium]
MDKTVLFWILFGVLGFGFALAVQMRVMVALVLRRALKAWRSDLEDRVKANSVVVWAAGAKPLPESAKPWLSEAVAHLQATYPMPLNHLRRARKYSIVLPVLLIVLIAIGRFGLGVI